MYYFEINVVQSMALRYGKASDRRMCLIELLNDMLMEYRTHVITPLPSIATTPAEYYAMLTTRWTKFAAETNVPDSLFAVAFRVVFPQAYATIMYLIQRQAAMNAVGKLQAKNITPKTKQTPPFHTAYADIGVDFGASDDEIASRIYEGYSRVHFDQWPTSEK